MGGKHGGGGKSGRGGGGGGGGSELVAAEAEAKSLNDQLYEHNSRIPGEPSQMEKIMHPEIAAKRETLNAAWKAKNEELTAKYNAASAKVESLKSATQKAKEKAAGKIAIKKMQESGAKEAYDKIHRTGIYKPVPKRQLTAEEKRIRHMLDHIDD